MRALTVGMAVIGIGVIVACSSGGPEPTNQTAVNTPKPTATNGDATTNTTGADAWAEVGQAVQQGDVRVSIQGASVGTVELTDIGGDASFSAEPHLQITVRIDNLSETKKLTYRSWSAKGTDFLSEGKATLHDEFDNNYARVHFGFGSDVVGQVGVESIYPGKSVPDLLLFEVPIERATLLMLELPAAAFGGTGMLRMKLNAPGAAAQPMPVDETPTEQPSTESPKTEPESKSRSTSDPASADAPDKPKPEDPAAAQQRDEKTAAGKLRLAELLIDQNKIADGKRRLQEIVSKYPNTDAAVKARELLKGLGD